MADPKIPATVLAILSVGGMITAVIGSTLLATNYAGIWAGVTIGGLTVTITSTTALYIVGQVIESNSGQDQR